MAIGLHACASFIPDRNDRDIQIQDRQKDLSILYLSQRDIKFIGSIFVDSRSHEPVRGTNQTYHRQVYNNRLLHHDFNGNLWRLNIKIQERVFMLQNMLLDYQTLNHV